MAYTAWSVVFGEQPTAAKWNQLGENDAGFKDGTNIDDNAILNRHMNNDSVTGDNLSLDTVQAVLASNFNTSSTSMVDVGLKVTLPAIGTWLLFCDIRAKVTTAGRYNVTELYNFTTSTKITDSERLSIYNDNGGDARKLGSTVRIVTTASINNSVGIRVKSGGAYSSDIESDTNGYSTILAVRIG